MRMLLRTLGLLAALTAFGCDSSVDEGPVPFKPTDTKQFEEMKNQMIGNMKSKAHMKNPQSTSAGAAEKSN